MEPVAKNIAQLRRKCGKTQQQLGEELGVSCQTVSKWECGVTLPDLSLIPALCTSLGVSADQLLGLVPLPDGFIPADTGESDFWAHRAQELRRSRRRMWNDDYLGFLVEKVWKLTEPVRVLDCGCGAGALGLALLPQATPEWITPLRCWQKPVLCLRSRTFRQNSSRPIFTAGSRSSSMMWCCARRCCAM